MVSHAQSFCQSVYILILTIHKRVPLANWSDQSPICVHVRSCLGKNIGQNIVWCSLMWLMPLRSLSHRDYELKNLPRLILGPIHPNQVMGTDPVGSHHGTRNSRSNSINPTYLYQSHDYKCHRDTHMCPPVQNNQPGTGFGSRGKSVGLVLSVTPLG